MSNNTVVISNSNGYNNKVKFIAHRGYSSLYTDNTIESVHRAMDFPIDMVETDLRLNKNGEWMIFHDATLINTDGMLVRFEELSNEQCAELDIITVEQFLILFMTHPRCKEVSLYLDIKGTPSKKAINRLVDLLYVISYEQEYPMNKFYLASFNFYILHHLTNIREMLIIPGMDLNNEVIFKIGYIGQITPFIYNALLVDFVATDDDLIDMTYIQRIKDMSKNKIELYVYVINDLRLMDYYIKMGVNGILSDDSSLFLKVN